MNCAYCSSDLTKILTGNYCYRRISWNGKPKLHSPWLIEPLTPIEKEY